MLLAVFLFSLTGLPPLAGFIGKFYLFAAVLKTHLTFFYVLAIIGVLNSVVSLYYYVRIVKAMFLEKAEDGASALPLARASTVLLAVCAIPWGARVQGGIGRRRTGMPSTGFWQSRMPTSDP